MPSFGLRHPQFSCLKCGQMNTASKIDSLGSEQLEHEPVRLLESLARQTRRAESVLVGHHDELQARPLQVDQRGDHPGQQPDLVEPVDLLVRRFLDQRTVSIHEQNSVAAHGAASRLEIRASFWARVPTVILNEFGQRRVRAHVAHDGAAGHARAKERVGIAAVDQQEVRVARPYSRHRADAEQALTQIFPLLRGAPAPGRAWPRLRPDRAPREPPRWSAGRASRAG